MVLRGDCGVVAGEIDLSKGSRQTGERGTRYQGWCRPQIAPALKGLHQGVIPKCLGRFILMAEARHALVFATLIQPISGLMFPKSC
jgi:hypothetical protein